VHERDSGAPPSGGRPLPAQMRVRAAGPGDAAGLVALKRAPDQETRFMVLEPGERTEGPGAVAAGLDQVARVGNSVVLVAESAGQLAGSAQARGGTFRRNRATAHVVIGVLAAARPPPASTTGS